MKNLVAEVIASGGGPAGVLLACELRLAGVDVLFLDRHSAPSGMGGALTADVLAQRGVTDLLAWADQLGVRQRRPVELATLRQDSTAVDVEVRTPRGSEWLRAGWLVDCDFPDTRLRDGRVLLAGARSDLGDGLEDAANLGWKLASVVRGHTGAELLDTYRTERATLDGGYRLGTGHPWLGRRVPDLDLATAAGSTSAFALLRAARPLLIDFGERPSPLRGLVEGWADRVDLVEALAPGGEAPGALLIRPDGYVAWVPGTGDLGTALTTWFGPCR